MGQPMNNKTAGHSRRDKIFAFAAVAGVVVVIAAAVLAGVFAGRNYSSSSKASTGDNSTSTIAPINNPTSIEPSSPSTLSSITPTQSTCSPIPNCVSQACSGGSTVCTQCTPGYELNRGKCFQVGDVCPVVALDKFCYPDISSAITDAANGSVVTIFQDGLTVSAGIPFNTSITILGNPTAPTPLRLLCTMNDTWGGMLRATGSGQTVTLKNLQFENVGGGSCTAFRTPDLGLGEQPAEPTTTISLSVQGCTFKGFETYARGGSAIFVGRTNNFALDSCIFDNNTVHNYGTKEGREILMWLGGGAIWVADIVGEVALTNNTFTQNTFWYPHGLGGALMFAEIREGSNVKIENNRFANNMASGGGAFYLGNMEEGSKMVINSVFENNEAREFGWKSRGGAVWLESVQGEVFIGGTSRNNTAPAGRGGAIANNMVVGPGSVTIDAQFIDNFAAESGSVWDAWSDKGPIQGAGKISLLGSSLVSGNRAGNGALMYFNGKGQRYSLTDFTPGQTVTFTSTGMT